MWDYDTGNDDFNDSKIIMGLDELGFPATAVANSILIQQNEFGDSTKQLEESWLEWLHHHPFDTAVATKLSSLLTEELDRMTRTNDAAGMQLLNRKQELVTKRAERYSKDNFSSL